MTTKSVPWRPSPDVVVRRLDKSGVLVHLGTNHVFELNETGIRIWELLVEKGDVTAVVACVVEEFDVKEPLATAEVERCLQEFRHEGFLL